MKHQISRNMGCQNVSCFGESPVIFDHVHQLPVTAVRRRWDLARKQIGELMLNINGKLRTIYGNCMISQNGEIGLVKENGMFKKMRPWGRKYSLVCHFSDHWS